MILYNLFPVPVLRVPADPNTYDSIQIEVKEAWETIQKTENYSDVTYLYKKNKTKLEDKTFNFIENYNCVKLKNRIEKSALEYLNYSGWTGKWNGDTPIRLKDSWLNVIQPGDNHTQHCHPGYYISGVYYFRVDESLGSIAFNNPNPLMFSCGFPQGLVSPQISHLVPTRGDIILFPSWLVHSTVKNNNNGEDRISVAFNIDLENLIGERVFGLVKGSHVPFIKRES
jgi:uncharacterized protein (TIGR02466 family)